MAFLLVLPGHGQAPQAEAPELTLRATTRLVLIDVIVTGRDGKPFEDLTEADFTVFEAGRPQKIAFFSLEGGARATTLADSATRQQPALPLHVVTNSPAYRHPGGPLIVLLLDALNTPQVEQVHVRQQMLRFLSEQLQQDARFAVLVLGNSLTTLQDFTSDPALLRGALERFRPGQPAGARAETDMALPAFADTADTPAPTRSDGAAGLSEAAAALVGERVRRFEREVIAAQVDVRMRATAEALDAIARALAGYPGRKSLLWFSRSFPFSFALANASDFPHRQTDWRRIARTVNLLSDAQVAVYPIDAGGLGSGAPPADIAGTDFTAGGLTMGKVQAMAGDPLQAHEEFRRAASGRFEAQSNMRWLAGDTGGRLFTNNNDIRRAISLALADSASYYTIGYYPTDKKWDRRFREVKVTVARQGATVRHRSGYYALNPADVRGKREDLLAALTGVPIPSTAVTFYARVPPPAPAAEANVVVEFLVEARTVSFEDAEAGGKYCDLDYQVAVLTWAGERVKAERDTVRGTLRPETYRRLSQDGIPHKLEFKLRPGHYQLRLGVRDNRTGLFGTTETSLVVPEPASRRQ